MCQHDLGVSLDEIYFIPDETIREVFFNLGTANSLQGSVRILKLTLFLVSRFCKKFNNISKVPRLEKVEKHCIRDITILTGSNINNNQNFSTCTFTYAEHFPDCVEFWHFSLKNAFFSQKCIFLI
jgi:hypothetical protein